MKLSLNTILVILLLILIMTVASFSQSKSGGLALTADQVKELVAQSYAKHQRLTVKIKRNTQPLVLNDETSESGSIQSINSDDFVLRRDDLFGGHRDLVIAYSDVISLKRQHEIKRVAWIIGNNAAVAPILPIYLFCKMLGAQD